MDKIFIRDLSLRCIIGIFPEERTNRQDVLVNVEMDVESMAPAAASDDIADTVDYKAITKQIIQAVELSSWNLIETMAEEVAKICLATPDVQRVRVTIDKPGALRFARSVAVQVNREQHAAGD